jgi:tubulin polyglutamylase TTLL6/13
MHLTNYAINKEAENFIQNSNADITHLGHKRSLSSVLTYIDQHPSQGNHKTSNQVWQEIKDITLKTIMAGVHQMNHVYKSSKPNDTENSLCFQILGIDIFLDSELKCWLLEVNQSPSFATDSPFDLQVKRSLIRDTLHILNLSQRRKAKCMNRERAEKA